LSAAHYENFPVASFVLPRRLRPAVLAIYRFARYADDLADEGDAAPAARLADLDALGRDLDRALAGAPANAMLDALAETVRRHRLPPEPFHDLLSAFRQDVTTMRYPSYAAVLDYCARSANPIGRLLLALYGAATPANLAHSDAICTALQLVNFWQDIAIDWRKGRVYLPREDLDRFGVTDEQIADARCDERWRALIAFETARTRALLASGRPLVPRLPWRLALELSGVLAGGHRILDAIDAADGDVFRQRPRLGARDWLVVAVHALRPPRRHRAAPGPA
jgi:squalene synthase HpnC